MLEVKNIIEDIVMDVILNLDEVKSGDINKSQIIEIASYVLNRTSPLYITSNRGFTSIMSRFRNDPQFLADLLLKVNEALRVVRLTNISSLRKEELDFDTPYYLLPKIYGKIISSRSLLPLESGQVKLLINSEEAKSLYSDWDNPLQIKPDDNGIFTFAPFPVQATAPFSTREFKFKLLITRGELLYEKFLTYSSHPVFLQSLELDFNENILQVEDIYVPF